jgi:hypothetical protein
VTEQPTKSPSPEKQNPRSVYITVGLFILALILVSLVVMQSLGNREPPKPDPSETPSESELQTVEALRATAEAGATQQIVAAQATFNAELTQTQEAILGPTQTASAATAIAMRATENQQATQTQDALDALLDATRDNLATLSYQATQTEQARATRSALQTATASHRGTQIPFDPTRATQAAQTLTAESWTNTPTPTPSRVPPTPPPATDAPPTDEPPATPDDSTRVPPTPPPATDVPPTEISSASKTATATRIPSATSINENATPIGAITATATPSATHTTTSTLPITASPSPTEEVPNVTEGTVIVRDENDRIVGLGTVTLYYPDSIVFGDSATVRMSLDFDLYYVTPTPPPAAGRGAVTAPPRPTVDTSNLPPTPTPLSPRQMIDGIEIYGRMGASLECSAESFRGCGERRSQRVSFNGESWTWTLQPINNANSVQDIRFLLWTLDDPECTNDPTVPCIIWENEQPVTITIMEKIDSLAEVGINATGQVNSDNINISPTNRNTPPDSSDGDGTASSLLVVAGAIVVLVLGSGGVYWYLKRRPRYPDGPRFFVSYRRDDAAGTAGRIYDRLIEKYGPRNVFRDVDTIHAGENFTKAIDEAISSCDVLVAVIGPQWLTIENAQGQRRLFDPNDFVRLEIASALQKELTVVPLLVERATMPRESDLPPDLQPLTLRHAIRIDNESFNSDMNLLFDSLLVPKREETDLPASR